MTSVQNRLQRLNGNKLLIFLLIIASISSCASSKIIAAHKVEVVAIQTKESNVESKSAAVSENSEDSVLKKPVIFDLENTPLSQNTSGTPAITPVKNDKIINNDPNRIHNIAVILPFFLDQIQLGQYADDTTKQLGTDSKNAMEFYLGCQMARQQFESENLKTNVYFLDDKNDSATAAALFKAKPFPNVDYIVGPLNYKNLKLTADLAKINQIPLISPLANSMYLSDNPYYFNGVASLKTQYSFILEQTKTKFPAKTLEVIYDGKDSTAENLDILKALADKHYGYANIKYTSLQAWSDASTLLFTPDTLNERIILIYSSKDSYVKSIIAKLKPLKNHLQIFTSSCSKNTKALTDLKNKHTVYTVYPFKTDNPNFAFFAAKYEEKYKKETTDIANQAYDLMMYLFTLLDKNLLLQDNIYTNSSNFYNTQTKFQFKPVLNNIGNVDYYDNTFLYLYRYVNGSFIIATP